MKRYEKLFQAERLKQCGGIVFRSCPTVKSGVSVGCRGIDFADGEEMPRLDEYRVATIVVELRYPYHLKWSSARD